MKRLFAERNNGRRYLSLDDLKNLPCLKLLNPFLIEEVIRTGERFRNSDLEYNAKHLMILPPNHPIITMEHGEQGHRGISHVLNKLHNHTRLFTGKQQNERSSPIVLNAVYEIQTSVPNARPTCLNLGLLPEKDRFIAPALN